MMVNWLIFKRNSTEKLLFSRCPLQLVILLLTLSTTTHSGRPEVPGEGIWAILNKPIQFSGSSIPLKLIKTVEWRHKSGNSQTFCLLHKMDGNITNIFPACNGTAHFLSHNKTFVLYSVRAEDEGVYEERVIYKNNTMVSLNISLSIISPPSTLHISVNFSHALLTTTCEVKGSNLSYWWLKDDQPFLTDSRLLLGERNQTLQVNNLTKADCGKYTCLVANKAGLSRGHFQLTDNQSSVCKDGIVRATLPIGQREVLIMVILGICIFGLLIIIACIRRYHQEIRKHLAGLCNKEQHPVRNRRGRRDRDTPVSENHVYDEIGDEEEQLEQEVVIPLPCVYTDFLPNRKQAEPLKDFGYSTIGPASLSGVTVIEASEQGLECRFQVETA
ncbi:leucine-rich repeats and immunoglobulin-like domains protein 3 isoform X1 [Oncorhynchus tshawytscha]|uniref:leucine-rich repeats and immunoglobulin-like domains protein 3 isoform X1 n=2 Tax=Oncorhynchus tshawytscha TaxID=74940 RepID=UPI000D09C9B6|nr:leucine-rich repeats and immunoglobulin-like domains protein 3 isoform X1 [Oncorhynchus tshawytscha]